MQQTAPKNLSDTLLMLFEIYDPAALGEQDGYAAEAAVVPGHRGRVSSVEETRALLCEVLCFFFGGGKISHLDADRKRWLRWLRIFGLFWGMACSEKIFRCEMSYFHSA